jgi:hypothetical protein
VLRSQSIVVLLALKSVLPFQTSTDVKTGRASRCILHTHEAASFFLSRPVLSVVKDKVCFTDIVSVQLTRVHVKRWDKSDKDVLMTVLFLFTKLLLIRSSETAAETNCVGNTCILSYNI